MSKFVSNSFQVPNAFIDEMLNQISGNACKIYLLIVRKTRGWHKEADRISYSQIQKLTGIGSSATVDKAISELVDFGLISYKKGNEKSANEYRLNDAFCTSKNEVGGTSKIKVATSKNEVGGTSKIKDTEIQDIKYTNQKDKSEYDTHTHESQNSQNQKDFETKQATLDKSKSKSKKSKSDYTDCPETIKFTDNQIEKCQKNNFDIDELFDDFKNWHIARGNQFKCWVSAFSTWINQQIKFEKNKQPIQQPNNRMNELRQMANNNPTNVFVDDLPPHFNQLGANYE